MEVRRRARGRGHDGVLAVVGLALLFTVCGFNVGASVVERVSVCSCKLIGCSLGLANSSGHDRRCTPACMLPGADGGGRGAATASAADSGCCPDFATFCAPKQNGANTRHDFAGKPVNAGNVVPRPAFTATVVSAPAEVAWPAQGSNHGAAGQGEAALFSLKVAVSVVRAPMDAGDPMTPQRRADDDRRQLQSLDEERLPTPSNLLAVVTLQGGWSITFNCHCQTDTPYSPLNQSPHVVNFAHLTPMCSARAPPA